jgi:hypothetical protein
MRLWTLHPQYLDARGLVALWREALLAQAVLGGQTRGYTRHPQLIRFRESAAPVETIARYLRGVHAEATRRSYRFDAARIDADGRDVATIEVTCGQIDYEWSHLTAKLQARAPSWLAGLASISRPEPHPLFHVVSGPVAVWEVARSADAPGAGR